MTQTLQDDDIRALTIGGVFVLSIGSGLLFLVHAQFIELIISYAGMQGLNG